MTEREIAIALAFRDVTFPPATGQKRFAQAMIFHVERMPEKPLTEKQARYLTILAWRYRRQLPATLAYPVIEGEEGVVHGFENAGHVPTGALL